jgi:hypothetical protein
MSDTVAIMGLGRAAGLLSQLPWLSSSQVLYWGDIDTWGLVILDQALHAIPHIEPILMDQETLSRFQRFAVLEPVQERRTETTNLPTEQKLLLDGLRADQWGVSLRLEQEKIPWDHVIDTIGRSRDG